MTEEVSVFCRIRPPTNSNDDNCIRVVNEKTVQLTPPESSRAFFTWGFNEKEVQYTFKKVFDLASTQKQVFDEVLASSIDRYKTLAAQRGQRGALDANPIYFNFIHICLLGHCKINLYHALMEF